VVAANWYCLNFSISWISRKFYLTTV